MADGSSGAGFYTAPEALSFLAYGDPTALGGRAPGEPDMWGRWGHVEAGWRHGRRTRPLMRMRWVLARVRWRLTRTRRRGLWRSCPLPPLGREGRAYVRTMLRRHGRPLPQLIAELKNDIDQARAAAADTAARLSPADQVLREAAAHGSLTVQGRKGRWGDLTLASLTHEAIPAAVFLNRHRSLCQCWGWLMLSENAPTDDWVLWRRQDAPDWGDLRFPTREIAALAAPPAAAPPPRIEDLPAAWTVLECVAWIALRDTAAVRNAAPDIDHPSRTYSAQVRLPDGRQVMAPQASEVRWSNQRLALEWAARRIEGGGFLGPEPAEAQRDLLTRLRAGAVTASGTPIDGTGRRIMTPDDWRGLSFVERGNELQPEPMRTDGQVWRAVRMTRDEVVVLWRSLELPLSPTTELKPSALAPSRGSQRNRGGAPPHPAKGAFQREAWRAANLDGFQSRAELREHMTSWLTANATELPDDSTVRRWLSDITPDDLPEN